MMNGLRKKSPANFRRSINEPLSLNHRVLPCAQFTEPFQSHSRCYFRGAAETGQVFVLCYPKVFAECSRFPRMRNMDLT
jgi:hypothetical protein